MSMEINGSYNPSKIDYAEQMKEKQAAQRAEKAEEAKKLKEAKASDKASEPQDAYISSEKSGARPSGLYRVEQDGNGGRKIFYDDPKKNDDADGKKQPKIGEGNPGKPAEKCTTNTDKVDREIEKLKEKKQQIEQQIRSAVGDPKKVQELEKKLTQVENELSQKDNDTYRRQQASVSE